MSPTLLFPLGLAALASLLVPLAIHLARRTEQQPTDFAALRWLRHKPRPRHRPRFDERLLLAVRLLLLALVALLLSLPALHGGGDRTPVVAVVPGVVPPVTQAGARLVWLAPGFPTIGDAAPPAPGVPVGSLVRQLDRELAPDTRLTVLVPTVIEGADAERPRVARPVRWQVAAGVTDRMPPPAGASAIPALRADRPVQGGAYLRAAVTALGGRDVGGTAQPLPRAGGLVWLAAGPLPASVRRFAEDGGTVLVGSRTVLPAAATVPAWRDAGGATLVEAQAARRGRLLRFTRALTPAAMPALVEPDFPRRLATLFLNGEPAPGRVVAQGYAPVRGAPPASPPAQPLWPWLAVGIAALFLVERLVATRSTRAVAP